MACRAWEIIALLEVLAPPHLAEDWDNVGLQVGSAQAEVKAALISLDADRDVVAEAAARGAGLLICHHPPIFRPLRRLVTDEPTGALLSDALASGVAVYAAHTNLDASPCGVNTALAELFSLQDHRPLPGTPSEGGYKLVTFVPPGDVAEVSAALFRSGAGIIGDYEGCSFRVEGTGTFTPGPRSHPAYGETSGANEVSEVRLELAVSRERIKEAMEALLSTHPYEEPAYDLYRLHNPSGKIGRAHV